MDKVVQLRFRGNPKWVIRIIREWSRREEKKYFTAQEQDGSHSIMVFPTAQILTWAEIRGGKISIRGGPSIADEITRLLKKELDVHHEIKMRTITHNHKKSSEVR